MGTVCATSIHLGEYLDRQEAEDKADDYFEKVRRDLAAERLKTYEETDGRELDSDLGEIWGSDHESFASLEDAMKAHTVNAAFQLGRDHEVGSITPGKLADFCELSTDPFLVDPHKLTDLVQVQGTWLSGKRIDLDAFLAQVEAMDPSEHKDLPAQAHASKKCSACKCTGVASGA